MKPTRRQRENLRRRITSARGRSGLSNAQIAAVAKVDPGQASRILRGQFETIADSVVRICNALGFDPRIPGHTAGRPAASRADAAWSRLEASVKKAWDRTPEGAERLARVIDAVGEIGAT